MEIIARKDIRAIPEQPAHVRYRHLPRLVIDFVFDAGFRLAGLPCYEGLDSITKRIPYTARCGCSSHLHSLISSVCVWETMAIAPITLAITRRSREEG